MIRTVVRVTAISLTAPVVITAAYLLYLDRRVSRRVTAETQLRVSGDDDDDNENHGSEKKVGAKAKTAAAISTIPRGARTPVGMPRDIEADGATWVLAYERVTSHPLVLAPHPNEPLGPLLTTYIRATMTAFRGTPHVRLMKALLSASNPAAAATFDWSFIQTLNFRVGDRVNGLWRISYRGDGGGGDEERIELAMDPPPGYQGPVASGIVVVALERGAQGGGGGDSRGSIVCVNETWMWRRQGEAPLLLEGSLGRWLHTLLSSWLVTKGVDALAAVRGKQ